MKFGAPYSPIPYASGRWYLAFGGLSATGSSAIANTLQRFMPFFIRAPVTISHLGVRITTASAGGFLQLAIYYPRVGGVGPAARMGTLAGNTGNIATDSAVNVSAALAGGTLPLTPGWYWAAWANDNGVCRVQIRDIAQVSSDIWGGTSQDNVSAAAANCCSAYQIGSQTFGTWPDLTGVTSTLQTSNGGPFLQFKVA